MVNLVRRNILHTSLLILPLLLMVESASIEQRNFAVERLFNDSSGD